jgi:hypothetical protein
LIVGVTEGKTVVTPAWSPHPPSSLLVSGGSAWVEGELPGPEQEAMIWVDSQLPDSEPGASTNPSLQGEGHPRISGMLWACSSIHLYCFLPWEAGAVPVEMSIPQIRLLPRLKASWAQELLGP